MVQPDRLRGDGGWHALACGWLCHWMGLSGRTGASGLSAGDCHLRSGGGIAAHFVSLAFARIEIALPERAEQPKLLLGLHRSRSVVLMLAACFPGCIRRRLCHSKLAGRLVPCAYAWIQPCSARSSLGPICWPRLRRWGHRPGPPLRTVEYDGGLRTCLRMCCSFWFR